MWQFVRGHAESDGLCTIAILADPRDIEEDLKLDGWMHISTSSMRLPALDAKSLKTVQTSQ